MVPLPGLCICLQWSVEEMFMLFCWRLCATACQPSLPLQPALSRWFARCGVSAITMLIATVVIGYHDCADAVRASCTWNGRALRNLQWLRSVLTVRS